MKIGYRRPFFFCRHHLCHMKKKVHQEGEGILREKKYSRVLCGFSKNYFGGRAEKFTSDIFRNENLTRKLSWQKIFGSVESTRKGLSCLINAVQAWGEVNGASWENQEYAYLIVLCHFFYFLKKKEFLLAFAQKMMIMFFWK